MLSKMINLYAIFSIVFCAGNDWFLAYWTVLFAFMARKGVGVHQSLNVLDIDVMGLPFLLNSQQINEVI